MFMYFLVVLAWIIAPLTTIMFATSFYMATAYEGSANQKLERALGVKREWAIVKPFFAAVVSWAYIFSYYFY